MRNVIALFHTTHVIDTHLGRLRELWIASFRFTLFLTKQIIDAVIEIHPFLQAKVFVIVFKTKYDICVVFCTLSLESCITLTGTCEIKSQILSGF